MIHFTYCRTSCAAFLLAILFASCSVAALAIDMPIARHVHDVGMPGDLRKLFSVSEVFAHGMGVALILLAVVVLDPKRRNALPRVAFCAYSSGLAALLAKHLMPRSRPDVSDLCSSVWETFLVESGECYARLHEFSQRDIHSFPSGHSATAVGLAIGLSWLYPRGRWLFTVYAVLAMTQRIESGAHFLSDTFAGAAIACLVAAVCFGDPGLDRLFSRLESL